MKRKSIRRGGGDDENGDGGTNKKHSKKHSSSSSRNNKRKNNKTNLPPPPPVIGTVAARTRRQQKEIATKWNEPIPILIHIMSYADPETVRMLCCVSKQFNDLIANDPGMEHNRAVPLLQISPAKDQEDKGRTGRLLRVLYHHRDKVQLYRKIKIIDAHKFVGSFPDSGWMELQKIKDTLRLYGVVSLDMSSPPPSTQLGDHGHSLGYFFSSILPNLRDINLSNNGFHHASLCNFSPNLEKLTWHNIDRKRSEINIDGWNIQQATNLKEMYMDDSDFEVDCVDELHKLSDLENVEHSNKFLFFHCSTELERVSIRNAKWFVFGDDPTVIPQSALIKFVRKAPTSFRWFRSHLTEENMTMLRSERPGIELVN